MCHQQTDSLKVYRLPTFLLFLFFGASFRHGDIAACPPCMRGKIAKLTAINILPANLLWLILLVPWYTIAALRTLAKGHSSRAQEFARPQPAYRHASGEPVAQLSRSGKAWHREASLEGFFAADAPDDIQVNFVLPDASKRVLRLRVRLLRHDGSCYRGRLVETSLEEPGLHEGLEVFVRVSRSHPPMLWVPPQAVGNLGEWSAHCAACHFELAYQPALELARAVDPAAFPGREPSPLHGPCAACGGTLTLTRVSKDSDYGVPSSTRGHEDYPFGFGSQAETLWTTAFAATSVLSLLGVGAAAALSSESNAVVAGYFASFAIGFTFFGWRAFQWARTNQKSVLVPWAGAAVGAFLLPALAVLFFEGIFPSL